MVTFEGMATITGRGNSTWSSAKKPYNLKFDQEVSLNGVDSAKTWYLLSNYADESQIRNAVCLYAANLMGIPYTSNPEFISLFINGEYYGLYNIGTKDIYLEDTGSNIVAVFETTPSSYDWISDEGTYIRFRYGDEDLICDTVNNFENALSSNVDYGTLDNYIEIDSFATKYLFEELFANHDLARSQYYAINNDGIISAICAWDYDLTLGISWNKYFDISYNEIMQAHSWYKALMNYDEFKQLIIGMLDSNSETLLNEIALYLDQCNALLANDWNLNAVRWKDAAPFDGGRTLLKTTSFDLSSLEGNISYILRFLENREIFLKNYWTDPNSFCIVRFSDDATSSVSIYFEKGLELLPDMLPDGVLNLDLPGFMGWYTQDDISVFDIGTITGDTRFYAAWESDDESLQEAA